MTFEQVLARAQPESLVQLLEQIINDFITLLAMKSSFDFYRHQQLVAVKNN